MWLRGKSGIIHVRPELSGTSQSPIKLLCAGCGDRAWCHRHSAVQSPLLKFTTVNTNEKSSLLHSVQYVYRYFPENRIPSNTSIDISYGIIHVRPELSGTSLFLPFSFSSLRGSLRNYPRACISIHLPLLCGCAVNPELSTCVRNYPEHPSLLSNFCAQAAEIVHGAIVTLRYNHHF